MWFLFALLVPVLCQGFEVVVENNSIIPSIAVDEREDALPIFKCGENGLFPNPRYCGSYIECSHHLRFVRPCPDGLHFRNETSQCEKPCDAHCDPALVVNVDGLLVQSNVHNPMEFMNILTIAKKL
ncbi:uncharacterized protein CDAR_167451 [Caerostris darwini]|uniref:Chitin-binding type-2 domain-containing protein n=1 Tax=Caerostris darwini TaxID=1538125 RepID=A0AAV4NFP5_9ARAC|nr:uncharacterized protein CDAR_167451 [Caerostris darwini]